MSEIELMDIFAGNLESKIREVGITQKELAEESGIYESTISRYLSQQRLPTIKTLINICYVLDCGMEELMPTYEIID